MMTNPIYLRLEKLLARWGGSYIWRVQIIIEIGAFFAASLGIVFILLNVQFSPTQISQLVKVVFILVAVVNILLVLIAQALAPHARKRLNDWAKGTRLVPDENELPAWREIVATTWQFGLSAFILAIFVVVMPAALYMYFLAGADISQAIHIVMGGLLSAIGVIILNTLLLELALIPPRLILLPHDPEAQLSGLQGRGLRVRLQVYSISLVAVALLLVTPRAYQEAVNAMVASGQNVNLTGLQIQITVIAGLAVMISVGLSSLLVRTMELPLESLIQTLLEVQKGNIKSRTRIVGLDEVGQIGVYLNQTLDQLERLQTNLEGQVAEHTRQLERNALQLRTAAFIARQNIGQKDLGELFDDIVRSISEQLRLSHTGIYLIKENREHAALQAAFPEGDKRLVETGYELKVARQNIIGAAIMEKRPMIMNSGTDAAAFSNPEFSETRSEVALPLVIQQNVIGVLDIQSSVQDAFGKDDLETLQVLADQIALAIENTRLLDESKTMISQLEFLSSQQTRNSWQEYLQRISPIYQFTPTGVKQITTTQNTAQKSDLRIPLILRGQEIGSIALQRKDSTRWTSSEHDLVEKVAAQIALALENSRLLEETRRKASQEQIVNEISARLGRSLDVDTLLQTAARELGSLPDVAEVSVYIEPISKTEQG